MSKEFKIIHVVPSGMNTGPVNVAKDLVSGLNDLGCNTELFPLRIENRGVLLGVYQLLRRVYTDKRVVLHSHGVIPDAICWLVSLFLGIRWISTVHCDPIKDLSYIYKKTYRIICFLWLAMLKRADKVVFLTKHIKEKYEKSNSTVICNCRNIEISENVRTLVKGSEVRLGFCGALIERKNIKNLVKEVCRTKQYELKIAGSGPLLKELSDMTNNNRNVHFLGHLDNLSCFWDSIDVLVLPSFAEGVPLVAIEALSKNIPLILMRLDNYEDVFTAEESIFMEDYGCSDIRKCIDELKNNYNYYSLNAHNAFINRFDFSKWVLNYKETYFE